MEKRDRDFPLKCPQHVTSRPLEITQGGDSSYLPNTHEELFYQVINKIKKMYLVVHQTEIYSEMVESQL